MKYYLFQENNSALVWMIDPAHPDLLRPYLALSCDPLHSIEDYFEYIKNRWVNGMHVDDVYKYSDFVIKSDSLDEIIAYAALERL